jgi:hypothetical protein
MRYLILLPFLITGCGSYHLYSFIDPELKEYVELYEEEKGAPIGIKYLSVEFTDAEMKSEDRDIHGQCIKTKYKSIFGTNAQHTIVIDRSDWEYLNDVQREILIFHELGHCDLYLGHDHEPSIMQENLINWQYYLNNREELLDELFGRV